MAHSIFRGLLQGVGGGGGGGGGFNSDTTPPALGGGTGCRLYVAAHHGLYTDAGSTLATAAGQSIYRWKDYSGNNNHLEQTGAGGGAKPLAGAGAQTVYANSYFNVPAAVVSGVTDGELFGLIKSDTDTNGGTNCGLWGWGGGNIGVYGNFAGAIEEGAGTTSRYSVSDGTTRTVYHVYSVRTNGGLWEALKNNAVLRTVSSGNTVTWTAGPTMGISIASGLYFFGECVALVFYAGARSSGERASIVAALLAQAPP